MSCHRGMAEDLGHDGTKMHDISVHGRQRCDAGLISVVPRQGGGFKTQCRVPGGMTETSATMARECMLSLSMVDRDVMLG